jgi:hypothetical protein
MAADVKANNILVQQKEDPHGMVIEQVQLADIEDAAYVPLGYDIVGKQVRNWMWRSPEAHAQGRVNKPSDIFSFGVVVSRQAHYNSSSIRVAVH